MPVSTWLPKRQVQALSRQLRTGLVQEKAPLLPFPHNWWRPLELWWGKCSAAEGTLREVAALGERRDVVGSGSSGRAGPAASGTSGPAAPTGGG